MKILKKQRTLVSIIIATFVVVIALMGAKWQIGQADTIPTIPIIYNFEPKEICVNSEDTTVTISGGDFIDVDYTWILWLDVLNNYSYIIPNSVSSNELIFTVEAAKLTQVYEAPFWIENHPPDSKERVGPFYIDIVGCEFIYLPLVLK